MHQLLESSHELLQLEIPEPLPNILSTIDPTAEGHTFDQTG
jgi:hypothetical protein